MIKTHKELASAIAGKKILHLNSLGKDSVLCLEWLHNFAQVAEIVSVNYEYMSYHTKDKMYLEYLKEKYPRVTFVTEPNTWEITQILLGIYQSPVDVLMSWNNFEYDELDNAQMSENLRVEFDCDYICRGMSRYESFARATQFHRNGLMVKNNIYPLGMMSKEQVMELIKTTGIKLHPQYKLTKSTLDKPTYYKMRSWMKADPEYKKRVLTVFPLLALDEYRYEKLLKEKT